MHYNTMILEWLEANSAMKVTLPCQRLTLPTLERLAIELKNSHEAWIERLQQHRPGSDSAQIQSEALEHAFPEWTSSRFAPTPTAEDAASYLDGAMAYLRQRTPLA